MEKYDLVVIGAGPGGYVAAIRAAQLGGRVAVVEKERLGGTCLNWGCIPTKALIAGVEILDKIKEAATFGIEISDYHINFEQMMDRKNLIVEKLVRGISFLLKKHKIRHYHGIGKIISKDLVRVKTAEGSEELKTAQIIIATGSVPLILPSFNYDRKHVLTSREILALNRIPESLLIVGAGVIGCEFANIFAGLGSKVTMVDIRSRILPTEDKTMARRMERILSKNKGINIKTGLKIERIEPSAEGITAYLDDNSKIGAEKALLSIGRKIVTDNLGLEELGIERDEQGAIVVNEQMETNLPGVYAIGDVTGKYQLAHVASAQGIVAASNIMGRPKRMEYHSVPNCIFTNPELASTGINLETAREQGYQVEVGRFSYRGSGKALAMGEEEGMVNLIVERESGIILGGQIMGAHASDLIAEITLAVKNKLTAEQLADTIHAHPTLAETVMEAAEDIFGLSIHQ